MRRLALFTMMTVALLLHSATTFAQTTYDGILRSLALPASRDSGIEIRVWLDSIERVNPVYRLIKTDQGVSAERFAIATVEHVTAIGQTARDARRETDTNRKFLSKQRCSGKIVETADHMWCRIAIRDDGLRWAVMFDDLLPDELWKLPPQEKATCGANGQTLVTLDGESVVIELIGPGRLHRVEYLNPDICCKTVACAIADHVRHLIRDIY